jgi:hypothetical protein
MGWKFSEKICGEQELVNNIRIQLKRSSNNNFERIL